MRGRWPARGVLAALLAWAPAAATAESAPPPLLGGLITQTRVLYPLQVGEWKASGETRYPDQGLGVSVRYVSADSWLDLYVYPAGPAAAYRLDELAAHERGQMLQAGHSLGSPAHAEALQALELPGEDGRGRVPARAVAVAYPRQRLGSVMLLFARNLYLVKARASAPARVPPEQLLKRVREFMGEVSAQLRIRSTGACWLPQRVELVDVLPDPEAPPVLASYRGDTAAAPSAVALVDAAQVLHQEAARAGELAAALAAAVYPGCVAPEAIEPQVPPHLREIRIEYLAPADRRAAPKAPSLGRPRLRSRGTG